MQSAQTKSSWSFSELVSIVCFEETLTDLREASYVSSSSQVIITSQVRSQWARAVNWVWGESPPLTFIHSESLWWTGVHYRRTSQLTFCPLALIGRPHSASGGRVGVTVSCGSLCWPLNPQAQERLRLLLPALHRSGFDWYLLLIWGIGKLTLLNLRLEVRCPGGNAPVINRPAVTSALWQFDCN